MHPDAGAGDAARMAAVNEAWRVLGDAARRAAYDAEMGPAAHVEFAPGPAPVSARTTQLIRLLVVMLALIVLVVFAGILITGFAGMRG